MKKEIIYIIKAFQMALHERIDVRTLLNLYRENVKGNPFNLEASPQTKYSTEQFTHTILFSGINRVSIELGATILKMLKPYSPSPDAVYDQINKLAVKEVDEAINSHLQKTVPKILAKKGKNKKKGTIVLDLHKEPYYGKRESEYIIESKPEKGTNTFHFYATACLPKSKTRKGGKGNSSPWQ